MKKFLCVFILTAMFMGMFTSVGTAALQKEYTSGASEWAVPYIVKMYNANICDSYDFRNFTTPATREDVTRYIINAYTLLGKNVPRNIESPFDDTVLYAVGAAHSLGIANGVSDTHFGADDPVTREEIACFINRMAKLCEKDFELAETSGYKDWEKVSSWAQEHVKALCGAGILCGVSEDMLAPGDYVTKEQAFAMVWRAYLALGGNDYVLYEDTSIDILVDLGIVSEEEMDMFSSEFTMRDLFITLLKFKFGAEGYTDEYFSKPITKRDPMTGEFVTDAEAMNSERPLKDQIILNDLKKGSFAIIKDDEIERIDMDAKVTHADSLLYILRATSGAPGCVKGGVQYYSENADELYEDACKHGLIDSAEANSLTSKITRGEFYVILHRALFKEYQEGGYAGSIVMRTYEKHIANKE